MYFAEDQDSVNGEFQVSDQGNEALKVAEFKIAAMRDKPACVVQIDVQR